MRSEGPTTPGASIRRRRSATTTPGLYARGQNIRGGYDPRQPLGVIYRSQPPRDHLPGGRHPPAGGFDQSTKSSTKGQLPPTPGASIRANHPGGFDPRGQPLRGLRSEGFDPRQPLRGATHSGGFDPSQPSQGVRSERPTTPGCQPFRELQSEPAIPEGLHLRACLCFAHNCGWDVPARRSSDSQLERAGYLQGRVLIARSPCMAPWDVQKVRAFGQAEVVDRFGGPFSGCLGVAPLRPESVFEPGSIFAVHNG